MAFLFLPGLPASTWVSIKSIPKAEPSVSLRGTSIQPQSYGRIFSREHYQWLQFIPMLPPSHSIVTSSMTKWISSLPDSLANLSPKPLPVDEKESKTNDGYGLPSSTSFARHHPPSSSWRTSQTSLTNMKHFLKYSQPWPRSGSMLNGSLYKRVKSVQTIKGIVCSSSPIDLNTSTSYPTPTTALNMLSPSFLSKSQAHRNIRATLPTPTASDGTRGSTSYGPGNLTLKGAAILLTTPTTNDATNQTFPLSQLKRSSLIGDLMSGLLPTPLALDPFKHPTGGLHRKIVQGRKTSHQPNIQHDLNGGITKPRLSPLFVEWMMGFHTEWTDLDPSGTQSSPIKPTSPSPIS